MVIAPAIRNDDYWSTEDPIGTPSTWIFDGSDGLDRLSGAASYSSPTPGAFHARLTRVQLDHIALEGFASTAYRSTRRREHIGTHPTPMLTFTFIKAGRLRVELSDTAFDAGPGEFLIVDSSEPVTFTAGAEIRALSSMIGIEHVPAHLLGRGATIRTALPRTPLVDSFVAFQATILSTSMAGRKAEGDQLIRAVSALHAAVLAEAQQLVGGPTGSAAVRRRMEEYIDAHLASLDLGPGTVAAAAGISLRHAHSVFNDGERTIGRFIRERRIEAVAGSLRTSSTRIDLADLADQHGFVSADAMSRAFHARYGVSPSTYRAAGHRAFG